MAPSLVEASGRKAGSVAESTAVRKKAYKQICEDHHFVLFAVETMGDRGVPTGNLLSMN